MRNAILRTLIYADIFSYPLKKKEIWRYLISNRRIDFFRVKKFLASNKNKEIEECCGYFFLKGRKKIVKLREQREKWSKEKIKIVQRIGKWLRLIPSIKMVGITGSLAMKNSSEDDDIDLLIGTAKNRLWLTRILIIVLAELMGIRRRPNDTEIKNKICFNMFLDESGLTLPQKERDIFSAHEICQINLVWERDNFYFWFLQKNSWVKKYLANWWWEKTREKRCFIKKKGEIWLLKKILDFLEKLALQGQLWYMKRRVTKEVITPHYVRFHPNDIKEKILEEYQRRIRVFNLL